MVFLARFESMSAQNAPKMGQFGMCLFKKKKPRIVKHVFVAQFEPILDPVAP